MFKDFVKEGGNHWYPIFSLTLFVVFFVLVIVRAYLYNKSEIDEMSAIPLEDEMAETLYRQNNNCL